MSKLKDKFSYNSLNLSKKKHADFEKAFPLEKTIPLTSNQLVGIEIEVENIPHSIGSQLGYYWTEREDGSLRNNGREYTSIPLRGDQVEYALTYLKDRLPTDHEFSNRCSVHVHLNMREMDESEVIAFILLYCIFEKHFFKFAHPRREASMFCVPLYKTNLLRTVKQLVNNGTPNWSKYSALNILPLVPNNDTSCYGTIEFRHLHGTMNTQVILPFINSMYALSNYVQSTSLDEIIEFLSNANSTSGYIQMYHKIFGTLMHPEITSEELEHCISITKKNYFFRKGFDLLSSECKMPKNFGENINYL